MFRRKPSLPTTAREDPLITADLPERVRTAVARIAHQENPALVEALSERELAADRAVAERIREHHRTEKIAAIEASEATAAHVRRATSEIVRADARDLLLARRALADHHREGSAHAQLAKLYVVRKWSTRALAGVVTAAMLFSAVNVQHNLAPGGPGEPLYWASYTLEALISTVLVVFMVSGSAVARWGITEGEDLIRWTEALLLAASIGLNTYPYLRDGDWYNVGVHSVAPVMIGVALVGHDAVSRRLGQAIALTSAEAPAGDDIADRLAALHELGAATTHPAEAAPVARDDAGAGDRTDMDEFERDFTARGDSAVDRVEPTTIAREPIARAIDREPIAREAEGATEVARAVTDRDPIARGETDEPRADATDPALDDASPIAREEVRAREENASDRAPIAPETTVADRAPIAAHIPSELGTDRAPIAARDTETTPEETTPEEGDEPAPRAVVALVRDDETARAARETTDRAPRTARAPIARETPVDGALARAADREPIARGARGSGPFARGMSRAEATKLARAVHDRGLSKQPVEVLTAIYEAHSQGHSVTHIGKEIVHLAHSTVGRAIEAADKVAGPRPIG